MSDWKREPQVQAQSAFAELIQELNRLSEDARSLTEQTRDRVEEEWFQSHTEIFPLLSLWKERVSASRISTFDVARSSLFHKPLLSCADSPQFPDSPQAQAETMDTLFGPGTAHLACLTIASQELHCDFRTGAVTFPLVLFERCCGLMVATIPTLSTADYDHLTSETTRTLSEIRRTLISRLAPEASWLAKAS